MDKKELLLFVNRKAREKKLYIVGAGNYGRIFGKWLEKNNVLWYGYIDKYKEGYLEGRPINKYDDVNASDVYLISSYTHTSDIFKMLKDQGADENNIIRISRQAVVYEVLDELELGNPNNEDISGFYNKYKGKRCFLVGNGPSLRTDDLDKIKNEYSFGCNSIYGIYSQTSWRPTYYVYTDPIIVEVFDDNKELYEELLNSSIVFSSTIARTEMIIQRDSMKHYFFKSLDASREGRVRFSEKCHEAVYTQGTVMYVMLQLAVYMGFSEVYLIGVDFNYSIERDYKGNIKENNVINHNVFIEEEEKVFQEIVQKKYGYKYLADIDMQLEAYKTANRYAALHGYSIYNSTRGGKLEVFKRVCFDSLF